MFLHSILLLMLVALSTAENTGTGNGLLIENFQMKMQVSPVSKQKFMKFLSDLCLKDLDKTTFAKYYIRWENVEFMDGLKDFLDSDGGQHEQPSNYFNHLSHNFPNNCSKINDKKLRDAHYQRHQETIFDNYMYDQMTRAEWAGVPL